MVGFLLIFTFGEDCGHEEGVADLTDGIREEHHEEYERIGVVQSPNVISNL